MIQSVGPAGEVAAGIRTGMNLDRAESGTPVGCLTNLLCIFLITEEAFVEVGCKRLHSQATGVARQERLRAEGSIADRYITGMD